MSKLIATLTAGLIGGLFATSIAFAATTPATGTQAPEATSAAATHAGVKKATHKHKHAKKVKAEEKAAQTK